MDAAAVLAWGGWSEPSCKVIGAAFREASVRGHAHVSPAHLLLALLHDDHVRRCLRNVEWAHLAARIDEAIGVSKDGIHDDPRTLDATNVILQRAATRMQLAEGGPVLPPHLFIELVRADDAMGALVRWAGFELLPFTFALAHESAPMALADEDVPEGDALAVVLHNDDYTSGEIVVQVLEGIFDLSPPEAHALMTRVHKTGRGLVTTLERARALALAKQAEAVARHEGAPLRVTLEVPT